MANSDAVPPLATTLLTLFNVTLARLVLPLVFSVPPGLAAVLDTVNALLLTGLL